MEAVDWSQLADAMLRIERLEADEAGLLSFGLENNGGIFVESRRICWAAVRGRAWRLRELLSERAHESRAALDAAFERCRAQARPVGQSLVEEGIVSSDELERALRRHSAECLLELCQESSPMRWVANPRRGYAAQFTFRPADLWLDVVAVAFPAQRAMAVQELSKFAGAHRSLAAFVLDSKADCSLPVAALGAPGVAELRVLAQFAAAMPRASLELAATPAFTLACTEDGRAALVWWKDGVLFAELCQDRESLAAATVQHLACA